MYVVSGLVFFVVAGVEATLMRVQLAWSGLHVVPPDTFNRLFTMHGTTMIFLVGIPIVFGFGNYLVPLMIGARDLAFPGSMLLGSGCCCSAASSFTSASSGATACTARA